MPNRVMISLSKVVGLADGGSFTTGKLDRIEVIHSKWGRGDQKEITVHFWEWHTGNLAKKNNAHQHPNISTFVPSKGSLYKTSRPD